MLDKKSKNKAVNSIWGFLEALDGKELCRVGTCSLTKASKECSQAMVVNLCYLMESGYTPSLLWEIPCKGNVLQGPTSCEIPFSGGCKGVHRARPQTLWIFQSCFLFSGQMAQLWVLEHKNGILNPKGEPLVFGVWVPQPKPWIYPTLIPIPQTGGNTVIKQMNSDDQEEGLLHL